MHKYEKTTHTAACVATDHTDRAEPGEDGQRETKVSSCFAPRLQSVAGSGVICLKGTGCWACWSWQTRWNCRAGEKRKKNKEITTHSKDAEEEQGSFCWSNKSLKLVCHLTSCLPTKAKMCFLSRLTEPKAPRSAALLIQVNAVSHTCGCEATQV